MSRSANFLAQFLVLILFATATYCVWYCTRAGIADALSLKSRANLVIYKTEGRIPDSRLSQLFQNDFAISVQLITDAPQYYEDQGYLYAVSAVAAFEFPEIAHSLLEKAEIKYRLGISKRPMNASAFANLGLVEFYLDKKVLADDFLASAIQFGQYDPATLPSIFFLANKLSNRLSEEKKQTLLKILEATKEPLRSKLATVYFPDSK